MKPVRFKKTNGSWGYIYDPLLCYLIRKSTKVTEESRKEGQ